MISSFSTLEDEISLRGIPRIKTIQHHAANV